MSIHFADLFEDGGRALPGIPRRRFH